MKYPPSHLTPFPPAFPGKSARKNARTHENFHPHRRASAIYLSNEHLQKCVKTKDFKYLQNEHLCETGGEGAVIVNSRKPSSIRSGDDSLVFRFNLQLSTADLPSPRKSFIHNFLATSEAEGYAKSPTNSFIYRFYAKFASKSFIYRIYVFAPGCGGLRFLFNFQPSTIDCRPLPAPILSTFNLQLSTSSSFLCVSSAPSALACAARSLRYRTASFQLSTFNFQPPTAGKHEAEPMA